MNWKIIVDSTCNLKSNSEENITLEKIPIKIYMGETCYIDAETIDIDAFINDMHAYDGMINTSCPSPDEYMEHFTDADNIIVLTLSSGLSGTYNSASIAKEMYQEDHPDTNIMIFDTLSCAGQIDLLALKIIEYIKEGLSFTNIVTEITKYAKQTDLVFCLANMDNLVKNGRISPLVAKVIGLLNVRLVGARTPDGKLHPMHKKKGKKRALKSLLHELELAGYQGGRASIMQVATDEDAVHIKNTLLEKYPTAEILIQEPTAVCCFYGGDEGILIGFEKE